MSLAPATDRTATSLGARLYDAMQAVAIESGLPSLGARALASHDPLTQALYERAAVRFTASLTYAESEGVREALISSVLIEHLRFAVKLLEPWAGGTAQVEAMKAAIAQAERVR